MKTRALVAAALLTAAFLPAAASPPASTDVIGKITFLEGSVEIERDEETLDAKKVREGLPLENFDLLITGTDGRVELQIATPLCPPATIKVAPRTRFSLEIGKAGTKQQTTVGLMIGSVTMKCAKLGGSQSVKVQTDTAVMGVRGTTFTVTAAVSGDLLVDCDEGEVECTDEEGASERAVPGKVIEKLVEERMRRLPVDAPATAQFRQSWSNERVSALKANALKAITNHARRYRKIYAAFNAEMAALQKIQQIIEQWKSDERAGNARPLGETLSQVKQVMPYLKAIRPTLVMLQPVHARLLELQEYHAQGWGRGQITYEDGSPESTERFFARFDLEKVDLSRKLARVRFIGRLIARRTGGDLPWAGVDFEGDPFFKK